MKKISFNELPEAVSKLDEKVDALISLQKNQRPERDRYLTISELVEYLPEKPSKSSVYRWVTYRKIPFHKEGKRLLFKKSQIDQWLENGRSMDFLDG